MPHCIMYLSKLTLFIIKGVSSCCLGYSLRDVSEQILSATSPNELE